MYRTLRTFAITALLGCAAFAWAAGMEGDQRPWFVEGDQRPWVAEPGEGYGEEMPASYLGIDVRDVTPDRLSALKLKEETGAEIIMVDQDAPAGKVGLKEHDVILQLNGQKIESVEQLRRLLRETPPGRSVTLSLSRDGQSMTLKATLADRRKVMSAMSTGKHPNSFVVPAMPVMPALEIPAIDINIRMPSRAGIVIESLTPQLGEYFGVKNGEGVLVRSVEKGSPAEQAGMKAGDIIIRVDKDRIADRSDWRAAMRKRSGKVPIGIIRERREQTITVTLPETKSPDDSYLDLPDVDLDALGHQLDRMAPEIEKMSYAAVQLSHKQMEKALHQANVEVKRQVHQACKEMDRASKEIDRAAKELEKEKAKQPDTGKQ